jgi:hypothetical protein
MQVRPIEFQESFARVPVEQARQQHILQREPDLARDQSARLNADAHLLDLGRPVQTTQTEDPVVLPDPDRSFGQAPKRGRQSGREDNPSDHARQPPLGQHIDVIA